MTEQTSQQVTDLLDQGASLHRAGRYRDAISHYQSALDLDPLAVQVLGNLGAAFRALGKRDAASVCYRRALALAPDSDALHSNMGNLLRDLCRFDEAVHHFEAALRLNPSNAGATYGMGLLLRDMRRTKEALAYLDQAVAAAPTDPERNWDRALTLLQLEDYENAWPAYEWRWKLDRAKPPSVDGPLWNGAHAEGKALLLFGEQGFGDAIQFLRFAPLARARAAKVILRTRSELVALFTGAAGVDEVIADDIPLPAFDMACPLLSLPGLLHSGADGICAKPYISAPDRLSTVRETPAARLRVAVVWGGSPTHQNDRNRTCPLERMMTLCEQPDVSVFSIQKGQRAEELQISGAAALITDLAPQIGDFADTAGILTQVDLVIAVDTAVAHLAGAMGRPVWVALPYSADWRWGVEGETTPWYATARLFRQDRPGDWTGVFERINEALKTFSP